MLVVVGVVVVMGELVEVIPVGTVVGAAALRQRPTLSGKCGT